MVCKPEGQANAPSNVSEWHGCVSKRAYKIALFCFMLCLCHQGIEFRSRANSEIIFTDFKLISCFSLTSEPKLPSLPLHNIEFNNYCFSKWPSVFMSALCKRNRISQWVTSRAFSIFMVLVIINIIISCNNYNHLYNY